MGFDLERAGEALVFRNQTSRFALLRMPGCGQTDLDFVFRGASSFFVTPGGRFLYPVMEPGAERQTWWYLAGPRAQPVRVEQPPDTARMDGTPILSRDGEWVAWVQWDPKTYEIPPRVVLRPVREGKEIIVSLAAISPGSPVLLDVDVAARKITLVRNQREVFEVAFDGSARRVPMELGEVKPLCGTIRLAGENWVAWDGYKEHDAYFVAWSLAGGKGTHRVPKGRGVQSVAVDPAEKFIGVSVGGSVSSGDIPDAVYVLRAADGAPAFRRLLPRYARSQVAFLGREFFAYTHHEQGRSEVRVLRVPE